MWRPCGVMDINYSQDITIFRTGLQKVSFLLLILIAYICPVIFFPENLLAMLILMVITIIPMQGLNIITGFCGQIALGQSAFMAVGGYAAAKLAVGLNVPFIVALPLSGLVAAGIGMIFGLPSLRVRGFYLALATIAAQFIIIWGIFHGGKFTGGIYGLQLPEASILGFVFDTDVRFYVLALTVLLSMSFLAKSIERSKLGRAFIAVRDNDLAAEVMGINVYQYKLLAFFMGSFYAGIAGALWAHYVTVVHPEQFSLMDSIWYLGFLVVGGLGSALGPIAGGVIFVGLKEILATITPIIGGMIPALTETISASLALMAYALVIMIFLIFEPRGVDHRIQLLKTYYRRWPFAK
ncbi:MAG: branched-chain amino acid ABC transporter permease [Desulfatiglans sp.]|nr:branched-chain amino acid ABC transporter permease [Thermodesulfobacteriota bacterium]MEE4352063.1 branched-chain amino acid ABC transporter permease [Desulfatiglans sp.]